MAGQREPGKLNGEELVKQDLITRDELAKAHEREAASGVPWYRYLLQGGAVSFGALEFLWREFHPRSVREEHQRLGQTLVNMNALSQKHLDEALEEQNRNGRLLGNILLERKWVTRETITRALAKQHGLEYANLATTASQPEALECVPRTVARDNQMLPIRLEGDRLTVLIPDPQIRSNLGKVGILLGKRIEAILTTTDDIGAEIAIRYTGSRSRAGDRMAPQTSRSTAASMAPDRRKNPAMQPDAMRSSGAASQTTHVETTTMARSSAGDLGRFEEIAREASGVPVVKLVTTIVEGAVNSGATDIHLDPQEPETRVRYRIDGVLHDVMSIPADVQTAVVSRVKIMSDMDITETRHPQDGHISMEVGGREYDIRVATLPTFLGERVVLRLLDQSAVLSGIKDLGLESEDEKRLHNLIAQPYGMILVTGPTGSGKTTTLYAALNQKNVMTDSIVTLEDPVEYQLSGINQVQIDTDIELTFASTLRAALRQDIDVLLVGEIRDAETARIAVRAAMTGHLVFSTLHTNDAPEAIATLRNMGIPSYLIASALTAVIGQRLVRMICPHCKTAYPAPKSVLKEIGLPESIKKLYKGSGCEACYRTGHKGRTGIFEVLEVTPEVRRLITEEASIEKVVAAAKLRTLADRCRLKVKNGFITAEEFLRTIRV